MNKKQPKPAKRRLSDREILRGALGGWIYREEATQAEPPTKHTTGAITFLVRIKVPAEAVARARQEHAEGRLGI